MCWVAIDRALRLSNIRSFPLLTREEAERDEIGREKLKENVDSISLNSEQTLSTQGDSKISRRERWMSVRDEIYLEIMRKGWNPEVGSFVQAFGSNILDASLMTMPLVFFLAPTDPRMLRTVDRINAATRRGGLATGGLVKRFGQFKPEKKEMQSEETAPDVFPEVKNPEFFASAAVAPTDENIPQDDGTFNLCTFWLIEALARAGGERAEQARLLFEQMLTFGNHLGLFSEETSHTGQLMGNFPQALTHVTLISAAFNLSRTRRSPTTSSSSSGGGFEHA